MSGGPIDMDAGGSREYLVRSVAIVTLLYERGILDEVFSQGRLTEEEVNQRVELLRRKYAGFGPDGGKNTQTTEDHEGGER